MNKKNILVFPCGSEVALEIHRSLIYSRHINLIGGSSTDDHGKFIYDNYIGNLPQINHPNFLEEFRGLIKRENIDAVYPGMDSVITLLKQHEDFLGCIVIASPVETSIICGLKSLTYKSLRPVVKTPKSYNVLSEVKNYPIFIKPDSGYGSRDAKIIQTQEEGLAHLSKLNGNAIITEYLPGEEFTVDCFTDKSGKILFVGPRPRRRIRNGISVNSISISKLERQEFENIAVNINDKLVFNGAWFFQVKRDHNGVLTLMEVASRMGGSSLLYRYKGVNFALLSVFNAFKYDVQIIENDYLIEIDRALDVKVAIDTVFNKVYVDFDDCLIIEDKVNIILLAKLYEFISQQKKIYLITRHTLDLEKSLNKFRLNNLFDDIIHLKDESQKKSEFIDIEGGAIFIDDSYKEREDVYRKLDIPVFSPDMICL